MAYGWIKYVQECGFIRQTGAELHESIGDERLTGSRAQRAEQHTLEHIEQSVVFDLHPHTHTHTHIASYSIVHVYYHSQNTQQTVIRIVVKYCRRRCTEM